MSDTEARAAERGDDEAAALVAWRRTHDPRACPVCGWAGPSVVAHASRNVVFNKRVVEDFAVRARFPYHAGSLVVCCGRCGVAYVEDAAGLSLECMEFEARRGEAK